MRPASSFLLSLLMFASIIGVTHRHVAGRFARCGGHGLCTDAEPHEYGVDVLQEFEDDVEEDTVEFSIHRPHRTAELNPAQDDLQ
jgi:hypothetical protein